MQLHQGKELKPKKRGDKPFTRIDPLPVLNLYLY